MKKNLTAPAKGKLKLGKNVILNLSNTEMEQVKGGLRALPFTASVCGRQCCDTDRLANCSSQPNAGC